MKEILKERLGLTYLPMLSEFWNDLYNGNAYKSFENTCTTVDSYIDLLMQPLKKEHESLLDGEIHEMPNNPDGNDYVYFSVKGKCYGFFLGKGTIQDLIIKMREDNLELTLK